MEIIKLTEENIDREHICCAISEKKGENTVKSKKDWLKMQFKNGLIFKKANVRGKVFIEYIPGENAWYPIDGDDFMFINCFWVSGQYKGKGISNILLNECIKDSKEQGKKGIIALSSEKKRPFLSDGSYLKHKGFKVADTLEPYFELLYFPFYEGAKIPTFKACTKERTLEDGFVLYYSNQCPFTEKYVNIIKKTAEKSGIKLTVHKFLNALEAKNSPSPFTTYSLFYNGKFITNEILSEDKFLKILKSV